MADFLMPALGADMETGKVVQWLVASGSRVKPGDIVAVVETHKGAIDVEIFLDGVIDDLVPVGTEMRIGEVLAHVRTGPGSTAETAAPPAPPAKPEAALPPGPKQAAPPVRRATAPSEAPGRTVASPAARRRAGELGLDLASLSGTGVAGAVTIADVEAAHAASPSVATAPRHATFDAAQMRQAIAAAMSRSKREIPHYYLASTIDFSAAAGWLSTRNRELEPQDRILPAALLLGACARALATVPGFNGLYVDGEFHPGGGVHLGWAIALRGGGLVAPAIHHADRQTVSQLMVALRDLVARARSGGLRSSELGDPTATVTSLGDRGAENVFGVIHPPQVAMIGFGRIVERPWVADGRIEVRPIVQASLAADHRVTDGHLGSQLLMAIDRALQSPHLFDVESSP